MANLSQDERTIITKHPLNNSLDHLQDLLRKVEQTYEPGSFSDDGAVEASNQGLQRATSRLPAALMSHEVALDLRPKTGIGDVASELSTLFRRVRNGSFKYQHLGGLAVFL